MAAQIGPVGTVAGMVRVLEASITPRNNEQACEDVLLVDERPDGVAFVAVIDGATDKSGMSWGGKTGGLLAAETIANTIRLFPENIDPFAAVAELTRAAADLRAALGIDEASSTPPTASVAILSAHRRELWRVGDLHLGVRYGAEIFPYPGEKGIDVAAALARAAFTSTLLTSGADPKTVAAEDPGRAFIRPLLEQQGLLANAPNPSLFAYGVINGTTVPERFIEVLALGGGTCDIVIASDGYLTAPASLAEAEKALAESLATDPMRIGNQRSTKGLRPGASSFDDRSYVRVRVEGPEGGGPVEPVSARLRRRFWAD